jgi:hypothetical protein
MYIPIKVFHTFVICPMHATFPTPFHSPQWHQNRAMWQMVNKELGNNSQREMGMGLNAGQGKSLIHSI